MGATITADYDILNRYIFGILNDDTRIITRVDQGWTNDDRRPSRQVNGRKSFHAISHKLSIIVRKQLLRFDYHNERQNPVGGKQVTPGVIEALCAKAQG